MSDEQMPTTPQGDQQPDMGAGTDGAGAGTDAGQTAEPAAEPAGSEEQPAA